MAGRSEEVSNELAPVQVETDVAKNAREGDVETVW